MGLSIDIHAGPRDGHHRALGGDRARHGKVAERVHHPGAGDDDLLPLALRGHGTQRLHPAGGVRREDEGGAGVLLHDDVVQDRAGAGAHQVVQGE
jgi:hypothetical protein